LGRTSPKAHKLRLVQAGGFVEGSKIAPMDSRTNDLSKNTDVNVLGIETSCDETGVAIYNLQRGLLADALHSQVAMHERYGGVVPELASRDHIQRVLPLTAQVLAQAKLELKDIDAIAYTAGPGLAGALLVGAAVATSLAYSLGIPALAIHHLEGHVLSPLLSKTPPSFPFVALLVSGGHTQIFHVKSLGHYELLGESIDDAAGEAFDKSAKLLDLGYPGGPAVERRAALFKPTKARLIKLPRPMLNSGLDFSFSGLKTAVLTAVNKAKAAGTLSDEMTSEIAFEVQEAITEVLVTKAAIAIKQTGATRLVVSGGVSANRRLRERLAAYVKAQVFFPELSLCTDNGAMIAFAGAMRFQSQIRSNTSATIDSTNAEGFAVKPRWPLTDLLRP
jgi:N6-L-threonylcarbamoyladenine synthase